MDILIENDGMMRAAVYPFDEGRHPQGTHIGLRL